MAHAHQSRATTSRGNFLLATPIVCFYFSGLTAIFQQLTFLMMACQLNNTIIANEFRRLCPLHPLLIEQYQHRKKLSPSILPEVCMYVYNISNFSIPYYRRPPLLLIGHEKGQRRYAKRCTPRVPQQLRNILYGICQKAMHNL